MANIIRKLILATFLTAINASAMADDNVNLIFKRPYFSDMRDIDKTKITINGNVVCDVNSDTVKIQTCATKVNEGEIKVKISTWRGSDYDYVIDVSKNKTYTFAVYMRSRQDYDLLCTTIGSSLAISKVPELENYNKATYKVQLISIN
jgi:hypothetical protein